jgi:hypothetical protein
MSLNKAVENLKYDSRLLDINLRLGRLTQVEYDQHIKALTDLESESLKIDLENKTNEPN